LLQQRDCADATANVSPMCHKKNSALINLPLPKYQFSLLSLFPVANALFKSLRVRVCPHNARGHMGAYIYKIFHFRALLNDAVPHHMQQCNTRIA
jgi:hypothetical protein